MRTLGKWAILTHDELEKIKDLAYQRGLRSKWRAKKEVVLAEPPSPSGINDVVSLLSAIDDNVVIPQRAA